MNVVITTVSSASPDLVTQLALAPWRLTPRVPIREHVQRFVVVEGETANKPAADSERVHVPVLAGDRGRHSREIAPRPLRRMD